VIKERIIRSVIEKAKSLSQESDWVSVEDRLPEDSVDVLMCYWVGTVPIIYTGYIAGDYNAWHFGEEGENVGTTIITHWMPLPIPPINKQTK
jgi:hypothetical protein